MLLLLPVALALVIGKVTGGSFRALVTTPIRAAWLLAVGFGIQVLLFSPLLNRRTWSIQHGNLAYTASLCIVVTFLLLNVRRLQWPILVVLAGAMLNLVVIASNDGAMPDNRAMLGRARGSAAVATIEKHEIATNVVIAGHTSNFTAFDDHIVIPFPAPNPMAPISPGDALVLMGGLLLIVAEMRRATPSPTEDAISAHALAGPIITAHT